MNINDLVPVRLEHLSDAELLERVRQLREDRARREPRRRSTVSKQKVVKLDLLEEEPALDPDQIDFSDLD